MCRYAVNCYDLNKNKGGTVFNAQKVEVPEMLFKSIFEALQHPDNKTVYSTKVKDVVLKMHPIK